MKKWSAGMGSLVCTAALFCVLGSGAAATAVSAQGGGGPYGSSILGLLPISAIVEVGSEIEGVLTEQDFTTVSSVRVKAYELHGNQGDPLTVDLMSADMDGYLYLVGPGYEEPLTDDDSGGACNARLNVFLPEDGPYLLVAGALAAGTGAFELRVDNRGHPVSDGDCYGSDDTADPDFEFVLNDLVIEGTLEVEVAVADSLSGDSLELPDGSHARAWWYLGLPGETVTIDLASEDFDAMLFVLEEEGDGFWSDDDGGGACNARVTLEITSSEPYRVVANSIGSGLGAFTLLVSRSPAPVSSGACLGA